MSDQSNQTPLNIQFGQASAAANRTLGRLTRALARNDYPGAERALYELQNMVELGLRFVQDRADIEDAPAGVAAMMEIGPWNPMDSVRVLSVPESRSDGDFYRCTGNYRQFRVGDKLVAAKGVWYRIPG